MMRLENEDKKETHNVQWHGMRLVACCCIPCVLFLQLCLILNRQAKILGDMAGVYFIAVAGIVAAFFGAQQLQSRLLKNKER